MRRRATELLLACLLTLGGPVAFAADGPQTLIAVAARPPAADFTLEDLDGRRLRLSALRGKVVLVNFWATWCPPCRREMPSLERLYRTLKGEAFAVVAVNVGEEPNTVFDFTGMLEPAPSFPIVLDRDSAVLRRYPVKGLPTSFLLDSQGRIAYRAVGGREFDDPAIVAAVRGLLRSDLKGSP